MNYLLDNGAFTIKFAARDTQPKILQNCIGRNKNDIVVSPKSLFELSEVLRPHERGVMVDPDLQVKIWKSLLPDQISSLVYTCPLYTPVSCRKLLDEIVYEDFNIAAALRVPFGPRENCFLVDLGFSASVVTPIFKGFPVSYAVKKVEIGGKLLTNYLKEQISYRYFDMTEETWLVNHIREEMCYISQSFLCELRGFQ